MRCFAIQTDTFAPAHVSRKWFSNKIAFLFLKVSFRKWGKTFKIIVTFKFHGIKFGSSPNVLKIPTICQDNMSMKNFLQFVDITLPLMSSSFKWKTTIMKKWIEHLKLPFVQRKLHQERSFLTLCWVRSILLNEKSKVF